MLEIDGEQISVKENDTILIEANKSQRIKTLYNLSQNKDMILISSLDSLVEKTISKKNWFRQSLFHHFRQIFEELDDF